MTIKADEGTAQSTVFTGGWLSMKLVRIVLMIVLKLPGALHKFLTMVWARSCTFEFREQSWRR